MACGKPIVSLKCRGINDLIENDKNGYVIDLNSDNKMIDFANCIKKIKNDNELLKKITKNNLDKVKQYDVNKIIIKMNKIYNFNAKNN